MSALSLDRTRGQTPARDHAVAAFPEAGEPVAGALLGTTSAIEVTRCR